MECCGKKEKENNKKGLGAQLVGMVHVALVRQIEKGTASVLTTFELVVSVCMNPAQLYSFVMLGICDI